MGNVSLSASQMVPVRGWRQRDQRCLDVQFSSSHEADMKYAWASVQSLLQLCKVGGESKRPSPPSPARWRRNVWQTHIHKDTAAVLKVLFFSSVGTKSRSASRWFSCKSFVLFLLCFDAGAQAGEQKLPTLRWLNWCIVQNSFTIHKNSYQSVCVAHVRVKWHISSLSLAHWRSQRGCALLTRFILCSSHFMHQAMLITIKTCSCLHVELSSGVARRCCRAISQWVSHVQKPADA